jgi:hypothetical protein
VFVLLAMAGVDWLLPSVQIPFFAYLLIILLWICKGAVKEAKKPARSIRGLGHGPLSVTWTESTQYPGTVFHSNVGWDLTDANGLWTLWQDDEQSIILTATTLGTALDQADKIIEVQKGLR